MTNSFYFSFDTKQVINPLEAVTHFYINPYMPESARLLKLEEKTASIASFEVNWTKNGIPVLLFSFDILDLKTVIVTVSSEDKIIIKKGNLKIYVKLTEEPNIVRIDSVLYC